MKKQIRLGKQCYVICPMVEESENLDAENVLDYSKTLQALKCEEVILNGYVYICYRYDVRRSIRLFGNGNIKCRE